MSVISLKTFSGIAPRYSARKLSHNYAQVAKDVDLWSGELQSLPQNGGIATPSKAGEIQTIFKLGSIFLHWSEDVDVVRAPLSTNDSGRVYFSGHYNPKATNLDMAQDGGSEYPEKFYRLGLPSPENAASVNVVGGTGLDITRDYVYTYVTAWGEESPPSPIVSTTGKIDGSWDLTGIDAAPLNNGVITNITIGSGKTIFECSANHNLETGDYIDLAGIVSTGNMALIFNGVGPLQITKESGDTFSIALSSTGSYTSGGTWAREADIQVTAMTKRIYRTVSGEFKFVAEIDVALTSYSDTIGDTLTGEPLPSADWVSPPADLKGLTALPNGVLVGFKGNTLHFSPPYIPHAFPTEYDKNFSYEIVGIAASGNNIIVATKGQPYIVTGYEPSAMSDSDLDIFQACSSKRSVKAVKNGVMYASPDGVVYIPSAGAPSIITRSWMTEKEWRDYNPETMIGAVYNDRYYILHDTGALVFDPHESESTLTELSLLATAAYTHIEDDSLFLMVGSNIVEFGKVKTYGQVTWKSKLFTTARKTCMSAGLVKFSFLSGLPAADNAAAAAAAIAALEAGEDDGLSGGFAGSAIGEYGVASGPYLAAIQEYEDNSNSAQLKFYVDGSLVHTENLVSDSPFRLPGGYNADEFEIELIGSNVVFHEAHIAETVSELAEV